MKTTLMLLFLFISLAYSSAQTINQNDSIILIALEMYDIEIDSLHAKYSNDKRWADTIFIEKPDFVDSFPPHAGKRPIVVVSKDNWREIYRRHNNSLFLLRIRPIQIVGNEIRIRMIPYHTKLKRKNLIMPLSAWTDVFFRYNCSMEKWEYVRTESDGI
jgi:hypothetical protein